jgi:hypothetical protein
MKGPSHSQGRRRWSWLLPLLVGTAFIAEIAFLGRLDMAKNAEVVESWTTSFYRRPSAWSKAVEGEDGDRDIRRCEERLESEGAVPYDRDFDKDPVLVGGAAKVSCVPFLIGIDKLHRSTVWRINTRYLNFGDFCQRNLENNINNFVSTFNTICTFISNNLNANIMSYFRGALVLEHLCT